LKFVAGGLHGADQDAAGVGAVGRDEVAARLEAAGRAATDEQHHAVDRVRREVAHGVVQLNAVTGFGHEDHHGVVEHRARAFRRLFQLVHQVRVVPDVPAEAHADRQLTARGGVAVVAALVQISADRHAEVGRDLEHVMCD